MFIGMAYPGFGQALSAERSHQINRRICHRRIDNEPRPRHFAGAGVFWLPSDFMA